MGHFNFYNHIARSSISKGSMLIYLLLLLAVGLLSDVISGAFQALFGLFG